MHRLVAALLVLAVGPACAMAEPPGGDNVAELIEKLQDKDGVVRLRAVSALGNRGAASAPAVEALAPLLHDPMLQVRQRTEKALAQIGRAAVPELLKALKSPEAELRARAGRALAWIGPDAAEAVPALMAAVKDKEDSVRAPAILALGAIGPDAAAAAPLLARRLWNLNEQIRKCAAEALVGIGPAAVAPLREVLRDPSAAVRTNALQTLAMFGPQARAAIPDCRDALNDSDPRVRANAAAALGSLGKEAQDAVPDLLEALGDKKYTVQMEAANTLIILANEGVPGLREKIREADRRGKWADPLVLKKFGPQVADTVIGLVKQLSDADPAVRAAAAAALGQMGPLARRAIGPLTAILSDENVAVRASAAAALALLRGQDPRPALQKEIVPILPRKGPLPRGRDLLAAWKDPQVQRPLCQFLQLYVLDPHQEGADAGLHQLEVDGLPPLVSAINYVSAYRLGFC